MPYSGKYTFSPKVMMPVDNLAVQLPKSMTFTAGAGVAFSLHRRQGPSVQTFLAKNVMPGKPLDFTRLRHRIAASRKPGRSQR